MTELMQLCVFSFCFFEDGDVWIGVFPQGKKILIRGAALGSVALHRVGAAQLEMGQRADRFIQNNASMVEDFLKLCCRFATSVRRKIGFSPYVDRIQIRTVVKPKSRQPAFIRGSDLKSIKRLLRVCMA